MCTDQHLSSQWNSSKFSDLINKYFIASVTNDQNELWIKDCIESATLKGNCQKLKPTLINN